MSDVLSAPHQLAYTYTRSTGPIVGAFLTGLRDRQLHGITASDGRVLCPPQEYDPVTAAELGPDRLVPVGPGGVVQSWTWQAEATDGQPYDRPFAWALVVPDGADTALLTTVGVTDPAAMSTGMRVTACWAETTTGAIQDVTFVPEDAGADAPTGRTTSPGLDDDGILRTPIVLDYTYTPGIEGSRFLRGLAEGRILGRRCPDCQKVYVPPVGACPMDGTPYDEEVEVADVGTVATFAIVRVSADPNAELPYVAAEVLLDGADITTAFLLKGVTPEEVRMGMRVRCVWRDREEWGTTMDNISHVEATGEPDADFADFEEAI